MLSSSEVFIQRATSSSFSVRSGTRKCSKMSAPIFQKIKVCQPSRRDLTRIGKIFTGYVKLLFKNYRTILGKRTLMGLKISGSSSLEVCLGVETSGFSTITKVFASTQASLIKRIQTACKFLTLRKIQQLMLKQKSISLRIIMMLF
mgnify:CR=1 FL=1